MSHSALTPKNPKKILIIEDEGDICLLLNIMLKDDNIDLDHVNTLNKAKDYLQQETPALLLLDNRLPDGLGMDFIRYIKSNYPGIKIIMISGFHPDLTKEIALHNGADIYLEKPFTRDQVYNSIQELLQLSPTI